MSWLAISDGRHAIRCPEGTNAQNLIPKGSLLIEVPFQAEPVARQIVLGHARELPWKQEVRISLGHRGDVLLEQSQGGSSMLAYAQLPPTNTGADLRITWSWHAPRRVGLLTVENLSQGTSATKVVKDPHPWCVGDAIMLAERNCALDPNVALLAVSDDIEPTGLRGGFATGTEIDTLQGPVPIEALKPGDLVQTSEHGMQPIRKVVSHTVPSFGRFAPIRLNAPFFGLERDLRVASDHRLLATGADAEYLFGAEEVLMEARYLKRLAEPLRRNRPATARYHHILFDAHVCVSVGGGWGESLYIGDLADHPIRHANSTLAGLPARLLPRHHRIAGPELKSYEAIVLVSAMCA